MPGAFLVGWVYNLHDPTAITTAPQIVAIALTFSTLATGAIALRFYVRLRHTSRNIGWDDVAALSSLVFAIIYSILAIYQTRWGQGLEPEYFPPSNVIPFSKIQYAGGPTYCLALLGFKLSLLASYLRIAGTLNPYRLVIYAAIAIVSANQIIFTCLLSFACQPLARQWDLRIPGHCIDQVASYYALAATSLGLDVLVIILPFPVLLGLQMHWKKKVAIGFLLALGLFVTMTQVFRIFTIGRLKRYTGPLFIWSMIEVNLGVIVCSIPSMAPLFRSAFEKFASDNHRHHYHSYEMGNLRRSRVYEVKASVVGDCNGGATASTSMSPNPRAVCESEEAIISDNNCIRATTEWVVEVEDKNKPRAL